MTTLSQAAIDRARADLAQRVGVSELEIDDESIEPADFSDAALGAPLADEMSRITGSRSE